MNERKFLATRLHVVWVIVLLCQIQPLAAQDSLTIATPAPDSVPVDYTFKPTRLIAPLATMACGLALDIDYKHGINRWTEDRMLDLNDTHHTGADDYLRFVPSIAHLGLGAIGVKANHNFKERLVTSVTAHAIAMALGWGLKYSVSELRPDGSNHRSFPSGHAVIAFTGAELVRIEYGNAWGAAAYGVASTTAFLRLYNHKHWLGDVAMGAGLGILSARLASWLMPFNRRLFHLNGSNSAPTPSAIIAATPTYFPSTHAAGLALYLRF